MNRGRPRHIQMCSQTPNNAAVTALSSADTPKLRRHDLRLQHYNGILYISALSAEAGCWRMAFDCSGWSSAGSVLRPDEILDGGTAGCRPRGPTVRHRQRIDLWLLMAEM